MHLAHVARRGLAVTAATALLASGGVAFSGAAFAAGGTVTSVTPAATNNGGNTNVTVNGSGFNPNADTVRFTLIAPSAQGPKGSTTLTMNPSSGSSTSMTGTLATLNAAPGDYEVADEDVAGAPGTACDCFTIASVGPPNVSSVAPGARTGQADRPGIPLDITGQNLAKASFVEFLLPGGAVDPGLAFTVIDPNATGDNGYTSSTLIRGSYAYTEGAFTAGRHLLQVRNTAGEKGSTVEFWQPKFTAAGVSPQSVGQGAQNAVITVTGQGIRAGSKLLIENKGTNGAFDVTGGQSTVSADGTTISAPFSFTSGASTAPRIVAIVGPDGGGYNVPGAFSLTPKPTISSVSPDTLGQGASQVVTINGSNFAAGSTAATRPTFTVSGTGVTAQTISTTNASAQVRLIVADDATLGDRSVKVTNPDGGTSTASPSAGPPATSPLTITVGPKITSISPVSGTPGSTKSMTITGTSFDGTNGVTVQFLTQPTASTPRAVDPDMTVGTVTVTKGTNGAPDKATFTLTIGSGAEPGLRDVLLTNKGDFGQTLFVGGFGIDSLSASPSAGVNNAPKQITFNGANIPSGSTVRLTKTGDASVQPNIAGSAVTIASDGSSLTATFDLADVATGPYNAVVTLPNNTLKSCTACFRVTGLQPTISTIAPAGGGQGAVNRPFTITGTNFSRGMLVTITGTTVHDVAFMSPTQLTGQVDIPAGTATGNKDVKVANNDNSLSATKAGAYAVSASPTVNSAAPAAYGQGVKAVNVTVKGTDFVTGSTVDLGPGVTVTNAVVTQGSALPVPLGDGNVDTLVATVNIAETAATGPRDVVVVNPDGGRGTLANGFTVNPGPKVSGITPAALAPGSSGKKVTITGSNFSTTAGKTAVPTITDVTLTNVVVAADGNSITADAAVPANAVKGARSIVVTNPTDSGQGTCVGCFAIATPPGAPTGLTATPADTAITVTWTAPADQGGSSITSYVLSAKKASDGTAAGNPATVGGGIRTATVTGLVLNTRYTLSLIARNAAGDSPAATITSTTTSSKATLLTSNHSPSLTTTGQAVVLSGRLLSVRTGQGIAGATVELALVPDIGAASFPKVKTDSGGRWSYPFRPVYSHTIKTLFRDNGTYAGTQAASYRMGVSTRVTVTSPANGSTTKAGTPLSVRGSVSPSKNGSLITLYRFNGSRYVAVQNARVSGSSYAFSYSFGKGNYTLKVGIGRTGGNFVGYSPAFGIHRV